MGKTVMSFIAVVFILFTSYTRLTPSAYIQHGKKILVYNVNIIDVRTGKTAAKKAILIHDNRIEAITDLTNLQGKYKDAVQIYAGGRDAIPGLWDMHVQIEGTELI